MKKYFLYILATTLQSISVLAQRSDCASSPYPLNITQSDGSVLEVITKGTESFHYRETKEGYTILPNNKGIYEYAVTDNNGNLQLSGIAAQNHLSQTVVGKANLKKGLRFSAMQEAAIKEDFWAMQAEIANRQKTVEVSYPVNGNIRVLAICMQFPDELPIYPISALRDLLNQSNYNNTGSFKDYFLANSYGRLNVTVDVVGWYTSRLNREQYGRNLNNGSANSNYMANVRALVAQGIDSADVIDDIDFSIYDNDSNGTVDGIIVFHSGFGAEQGMNGYIWSHRSSLFGNSVRVKDGKTITNYCINPLKRNWQSEVAMVGLGVLTHEFGHIMGLPDLYDTQGSSNGIGNFGLMGSCGWLNQERTPCQLEAWSKDQFDWVRPIVVSKEQEFRLPSIGDSSIVLRINTARANEYFLVENRQQKGWDRFLPSRGLAIWHINTQRTGLYPGSNTVNTDTARYGVGLKQADGQNHLEKGTNRGDLGDLFPGSIGNRNFTDNTNPNSRLHVLNGIKVPSNVSIVNITLNPDSTVSFRVSTGAVAAITPLPQRGCVPLNVQLQNNSIGFASFKWHLPDGTIDSVNVSPNFVFTEPGTYNVLLIVRADNQSDSSVVSITVDPSPTAAHQAEQWGDSILFRNISENSSFGQWRFTPGGSSVANELRMKIPEPWMDFILVAFSNNGCTDTSAGRVYPFPTSLQSAQKPLQWRAYPNPFSDELILSTPNSNQPVSIYIYNALGKLLDSRLIHSENEMKITGLDAAGIYAIKIQSGEHTQLIRVIKSK